ncbi:MULTISPECIES: tetratricopeptide repeat protein [Paenibacillus]|uniref:Tetratricopeptide repeat protein n=1 Tax=Paenibacillus radicis (ex Xue et al. 2023) TaxID=2972489 RepID=A0ABT1YMT7_9BACL|nr:tetratricopeptide repeat protein [Paenibacillus radicis (ex Xue et al. 2023)]MCR8634495.1 tetratricopeptide repeat protein [Paenibacillus radicis (ex Xue et al. 2023)]
MDGEEQIKKAYESILMHDFEQAIEWFEQAIAIAPDNAAFHYKLSITYARSNKLGKAIEHAKEAVRLEPFEEHYRFHIQHLRAKELILQAQYYFDEPEQRIWMAVTLLQEAIKLDSLSSEAFLLLGLAYSRLKEYSQAIRAIKELLVLDPQHEIGNQLLAEYQLMLKQYMKS